MSEVGLIALPMTAVIVTIGIAVNSRITTQTSAALARVEHVQYPTVEALRSLRSEVTDIQESLQRAVAEGDKDAMTAADQHASNAPLPLKLPRRATTSARHRSGRRHHAL